MALDLCSRYTCLQSYLHLLGELCTHVVALFPILASFEPSMRFCSDLQRFLCLGASPFPQQGPHRLVVLGREEAFRALPHPFHQKRASLNTEFVRLQGGCTSRAEAVGKVLGLWRVVVEM